MILFALAIEIVAVLAVRFPRWPVQSPERSHAAALRVLTILDVCKAEGITARMCTHVVAECFVESGLRARRPRASLCGCQPYGTDDATQARCAVRAVSAALAACETADEASTRYVDGRCRLPWWTAPAWRRHVAEHVAQARATRAALDL